MGGDRFVNGRRGGQGDGGKGADHAHVFQEEAIEAVGRDLDAKIVSVELVASGAIFTDVLAVFLDDQPAIILEHANAVDGLHAARQGAFEAVARVVVDKCRAVKV